MTIDRQINGYLGEQRTAEVFLQYGWDVNTPLIASTEYDLHVRKGDTDQYVQCKYRKVQKGSVQIENRRRVFNHNTGKFLRKIRYNKNSIGIFSVYVPDIDQVLLIKSSDFDLSVTFRVAPNCRQKTKVRNATDYIEPKWLISGNLS